MNPDISVVRTPDDLIEVVAQLGPEVLQDICLTQVIMNPQSTIDELTNYLIPERNAKVEEGTIVLGPFCYCFGSFARNSPPSLQVKGGAT